MIMEEFTKYYVMFLHLTFPFKTKSINQIPIDLVHCQASWNACYCVNSCHGTISTQHLNLFRVVA